MCTRCRRVRSLQSCCCSVSSACRRYLCAGGLRIVHAAHRCLGVVLHSCVHVAQGYLHVRGRPTYTTHHIAISTRQHYRARRYIHAYLLRLNPTPHACMHTARAPGRTSTGRHRNQPRCWRWRSFPLPPSPPRAPLAPPPPPPRASAPARVCVRARARMRALVRSCGRAGIRVRARRMRARGHRHLNPASLAQLAHRMHLVGLGPRLLAIPPGTSCADRPAPPRTRSHAAAISLRLLGAM